jgi:hypothetical protein
MLLINPFVHLKSSLDRDVIRRWIFGCSVVVYVSSCTDILISFYSLFSLDIQTTHWEPAEKSEDEGNVIGWLMSMTEDQIKQETVPKAELGKDFFDDNGT